jgi:hypothetical protein
MAIALKDYDPAVMAGATVTVSGAMSQITDTNNNEALIITATTSAVNELTLTNSATGNAVQLATTGDDTNIAWDLSTKGTGTMTLWSGAKTRELLVLPNVASAVNYVQISGSAANATTIIESAGDSTNIPLTLKGKGTGAVILGVATSTDVRLAADQPIGDSAGNEYLKFSKASSAVNEITVSNAATTTPPVLAATGGDTNISLRLTAKGTGVIQTTQPLTQERSQSTETDSATLTIAKLLTGIIDGTPVSAANYALPTAANFVGGIANCQVGDSFSCFVANHGADADAITITAGGATLFGTATIAQNTVRQLVFVVTNVTGGAEAYFAYCIGA